MKMSFRFRLGAAFCVATLFIVGFSFISPPARADKAGNAAKAAEKAVAKAEKLKWECEVLKSAAERADFERRQALKRAKDAAGTDEAAAREKEARKAVDEDAAARTAANVKCGEAEEAWKAAEAAIKKAEELLKEKTDRGGNVKDDENLDDKLKGLKERLPKKPEQATVIPPSPGQTAQTQTSNGLRTITFDATPGQIKVHLPDDMRAGDTISGTVYAEPKGQTEEERAQNRAMFGDYKLEIEVQGGVGGSGGSLPLTPEGIKTFTINPSASAPNSNFTFTLPSSVSNAGATGGGALSTGGGALNNMYLVLKKADEQPKGMPPVFVSQPVLVPLVLQSGMSTGTSFIALPPGSTVLFEDLPTLGQQGRSVEIHGPFDGNAGNTTLRFVPVGGATQDFEKKTETVTGGYGPLRPLAESPRKIVFESPTNFTGPAEIVLKEGDMEKKGNYRNLGVNLSAPKTNLMRGERTTLMVEVKGLEGIREDVPLQLDSKGVIMMDGGNFQNLRIRPQEVKPDGRYTLTRAITGQQAGAFNVTATVIVRRFDMCLQDDRDPLSRLHWNSFTGDYVFVGPGPAGQPGASGGKLQPGGGAAAGGAGQTAGATQTGGSGGRPPADPVPPPGGLNLSGIGKPSMKGCIITLSHNAPDRRVFARLDVCTRTGSGEVQQSAPKTDTDIADGNTSDSACPGK